MNRVRDLRRASGLQQKEVASQVGVSRPTVSEWESNKKDPSGANIKRLAELFGCEPDYILIPEVIMRPDTARRLHDCERDADLSSSELIDLITAAHDNPDLLALYRIGRKASPQVLRSILATIDAWQGGADDE